jgi:hypothetical protein
VAADKFLKINPLTVDPSTNKHFIGKTDTNKVTIEATIIMGEDIPTVAAGSMTYRNSKLDHISQVLVSITILNLTHLSIRNQEAITLLISRVGPQVLIQDTSHTTKLKISTKANPLPTSPAVTNPIIHQLIEDLNKHSKLIQETPNQAETKTTLLIKISTKMILDKGTTIKSIVVHHIPTKKFKVVLINSFRCIQTKSETETTIYTSS